MDFTERGDSMDYEDNQDVNSNFTLPNASQSDLQGRQSVRATFKLSEKTINAVSIVATHLGIKQKSLFDHLIEDVQLLCSIASECKNVSLPRTNRVQKTYVISRKSLYSLDKISKDYDAPRDALIEYSVQRLLPIIRREKEKHRKRKEILKELAAFFNEGKRILIKSKVLLGENDPIYSQLHATMSGCESTFRKIESFIQKGEIIEDF